MSSSSWCCKASLKMLAIVCESSSAEHLRNSAGISSCQSMTSRAKKKYVSIDGSFFQHGNNSGKRDTVAFQGACIECNVKVDAMGMSIATEMLSFPDIYDTLRLAGNTYFFGIVKREYRSKKWCSF